MAYSSQVKVTTQYMT